MNCVLKEFFLCVLALVFGLILSGCASLAGTSQLFAFDAADKAVTVTSSNGSKLGVTPFVVEQPRRSRQKFIFEEPSSGKNIRELNCKYRILFSGILNFPIVGQLVDLLTGSAWECGYFVSLNQTFKSSIPCPKAALIIEGIESIAERENIHNQWLKELQEKKNCIKFAEFNEIETNFIKFNIDRSLRPSEWNKPKLLSIAKELQFSEIWFAQLNEAKSSGKNAEFQISVWTLRGEEPIAKNIAKNAILSVPVSDAQSRLKGYLKPKNIVYFLPNSFLLGIGLKTSVVERQSNVTKGNRYQIGRKAQKGSFVGYVTSYEHRNAYGLWDYSIQLLPEFSFFYGSETKIYKPNFVQKEDLENKEEEFQVNYAALGLLYGGKVTLYTPLVSTFVSLTTGPAWRSVELAQSRVSKFGLNTSISLGFNRFFGENILGFLDFNYTYGDVQFQKYVYRGSSQIAAGIGYYFGRWKVLMD